MTDTELKEQIDLLIKQYFSTTGFWIEQDKDENEMLLKKIAFLFDEHRRLRNIVANRNMAIGSTC